MSWRLIAFLFCLGEAFVCAQEVPVEFRVFEPEDPAPLPCRIHLKSSKGTPVQPAGLPFWKDHFVCPGQVNLRLTPGDYTYEIERGPEYLSSAGKLVALAGSPAMIITNRLKRITNLAKEGWWSGEFHVHRPLSDIELLMRAEDLHIAPVITWWNNSNAWTNEVSPSALLKQFDTDRFYHVMGGEDERNGGALLYFNLDRPLKITGANREFPSPIKFLTEARQNPRVWVDLEKPFWYDTPVWLATGMLDSIGIANNHMHRIGMLPNEAWGRARDKQKFPDPKGNGFWTQEIYYHALNCGFRLPPSAGSASGVLPNPVGYNRLYVHLDAPLTYDGWWAGVRAGRVFVSNGPLLRCKANGQLPGHVFQAAPDQQIRLRIEAIIDSRDPVQSLEVIKNGRVERTIPFSEWERTRSLGELSFNESGWFLIRLMADVPDTFRFASTGPFYVEVGSRPARISKSSAQFFLDWVRERAARISIDSPEERTEVLRHHSAAEKFWQEKLAQANAD